MAKILIVEDHPVVVEGFRKMLMQNKTFEICGFAFSGAECLEHLKSFQPQVILMDINLPDISGIDLCLQVKQKYPNIKVLGISSFKEKSFVKKMMENGASGYMLKNAMPDEIIYGINQVLDGKKYLDDEIQQMLEEKAPNNAILLTRREKEVLALIADGFTNQQIAEKLFVSATTVDSHRKNMLMKLGAKNTAELIKKAFLMNLIVNE